MTEYIDEGFNTAHRSGALFLDVAKAFDRVWINALTFKLISMNAPDYLIKTIHSYLTKRTFTVQVRNSYSSTRIMQAGSLQGSVLDPHIYNIFINDILQTKKIQLFLFANDTAIISPSRFNNASRNIFKITLNKLKNGCSNGRLKSMWIKALLTFFSNKHNYSENILH